jgi:hydrogenase expression/formation protein HypD
VPGSNGDLFTLKSQGADIRVVYSPLDCLKIARVNPDKHIVFLRSVLRPLRRPMPCLHFERKRKAHTMFLFWFRIPWCLLR